MTKGGVDDYAKSFNNLVIKVPGMTLEEKLYIFIKGLKTNIQISVDIQGPQLSTKPRSWMLVLTESLANNAAVCPLAHLPVMGHRFFARPEPMENGAVAQRRPKLDLDECEMRRVGRLCFACGKYGYCAFEHAADCSPPAGNYARLFQIRGATSQEGTSGGGKGLEGRLSNKEATCRLPRQTKLLYLLYEAEYPLIDPLYPLALTAQQLTNEMAVGRSSFLHRYAENNRCNKDPRSKKKPLTVLFKAVLTVNHRSQIARRSH
jgi:hypothetical protein